MCLDSKQYQSYASLRCNALTGSTTYTCMLNNNGGIESDLTVSVVDDDGPEQALGVTGMSMHNVLLGQYGSIAGVKLCILRNN